MTVAIPFHGDQGEYFKTAIRSVFAQTLDDWELWLVSDNAAEGALDVAHAISDTRVRVIHDGTNRGLATRLNQVADLATAPYLARMDADDVMHPSRLERQLEILRDDARGDVVGSRAIVIDEDNTPEGLLREEPAMPSSPAGYLVSNAFTHPTVTGRTRWFRGHRYDPSIRRAEDKDLWLRAQADSRFVKIADPLLYYRIESKLDRRKCINTAIDDRAVTSKYRSLATRTEWMRLLARSYLAETAYRLAPDLLLDKARAGRVEAATSDPAGHAATIDVVSRTKVPGW